MGPWVPLDPKSVVLHLRGVTRKSRIFCGGVFEGGGRGRRFNCEEKAHSSPVHHTLYLHYRLPYAGLQYDHQKYPYAYARKLKRIFLSFRKRAGCWTSPASGVAPLLLSYTSSKDPVYIA